MRLDTIKSVICFTLTLGFHITAMAQQGEIRIGAGYGSEDSFRPAQFNGHPESGAYSVGSIEINDANESDNCARFWNLRALDLGLDRVSGRANFGCRGRYAFHLSFDQLPHAEIGIANTVYNGSGSGLQTLPQNWVGAGSTAGFTALGGKLKSTSVTKKRERLKAGLDWRLSTEWSMKAEFRHENKQGSDSYGAIFGSTGGNPRGALLLRPIDFLNDEISINVDHASPVTQYGASYTIARFENRASSLRFQNAFNNSQWATGANFSDGAYGQIGLEPDNRSTGYNIYLGHELSPGSRLTVTVGETRLRQDEEFLPYSSALPSTADLPRLSLNGKVDILTANLGYSSRLGSRTSLRLNYRYRNRDNQTDQALFQRIPGDAALQNTLVSNGTRVNRIYDLQSGKFSAEVDYRFMARSRLTLGFEADEKDYSMLDAESTSEDSVFARLNLAPFSNGSGWLKIARSDRKAAGYDSTRPFVSGYNPDYVAMLVGTELMENDPYLRRYHISDRDRDAITASYNLMLTEKIGLGMVARAISDDFPGALVGRTRSSNRGLTLDLDYQPGTDWHGSVYYSREHFEYDQNGFARSGGGNPTPFYPLAVRDPDRNWQVNSADRVNSWGAGLDWSVDDRLQLRGDLNYSDAATRSRPFSSGQPWLPLPDVDTEILSLSLTADYQLASDRSFRVRYFYEDYSSSDFALDQVLADTLSNVMLLGNSSPRYLGHWLELSLSYKLF